MNEITKLFEDHSKLSEKVRDIYALKRTNPENYVEQYNKEKDQILIDFLTFKRNMKKMFESISNLNEKLSDVEDSLIYNLELFNYHNGKMIVN